MREAFETIVEYPWVSVFIAIFIWGCIALIFQGIDKESDSSKGKNQGGADGY